MDFIYCRDDWGICSFFILNFPTPVFTTHPGFRHFLPNQYGFYTRNSLIFVCIADSHSAPKQTTPLIWAWS